MLPVGKNIGLIWRPHTQGGAKASINNMPPRATNLVCAWAGLGWIPAATSLYCVLLAC